MLEPGTLPPCEPTPQPPPAAEPAKPNGHDHSAEGLKSAISALRRHEERQARERTIERDIAAKCAEIGGYESTIEGEKAKLKAAETEFEKLVAQLRAVVRGEPVQEDLPFKSMGQGETPNKGTAADAMKEGFAKADREDFAKLSLRAIGLSPKLAEKFVAGGIDAGEKLRKWLISNPRPPVLEVKDRDAVRAMKLMEDWFEARKLKREVTPKKLKPGRNSLVGDQAKAHGEHDAAMIAKGKKDDPDAVPLAEAMKPGPRDEDGKPKKFRGNRATKAKK